MPWGEEKRLGDNVLQIKNTKLSCLLLNECFTFNTEIPVGNSESSLKHDLSCIPLEQAFKRQVL